MPGSRRRSWSDAPPAGRAAGVSDSNRTPPVSGGDAPPADHGSFGTRHNPPPRGAVDRFIRRFSQLSLLLAVLALYALLATAVGLALAPALWFVDAWSGWTGGWTGAWHWLGRGLGYALAFLVFGFALLCVVPVYNWLLPTRATPFKGGYFSIPAVPWLLHNGLFYLVRFTFLPFVTLTPMGGWFLSAMGMRLGKRVFVNTEYISDPRLITLGDDVVILSRPAAGATTPASTRSGTPPAAGGIPVQTTLALSVDLGPDFRVQGRGIVTRLAGTLQLRGNAGEAPRLNGEVRTVLGTYRAYGQRLDIEQGVLRFTGSFDNPSLDILAVRPNLSQRVGVQITGTAAAPRVRLFSEPELPEAEKLAWLVLGRSGANGGAEAAVLQQAALALLGRNGQGLSGGLANALGLDELSIAGAATRTDGTTSAATVTLGKRISRDFYVAYERSLAGTLGTISIFYDLSRRFTLRARTEQL